jgi:hypothetical protein
MTDVDATLPEVTDDAFAAARQGSRPFTISILHPGPRYAPPDRRTDEITATIMAHGKRNYRLHLAGLLPVVCPVADGTDVSGIGIFAASLEETAAILDADPAIRAGILTYELHPTRTMTIGAASSAAR